MSDHHRLAVARSNGWHDTDQNAGFVRRALAEALAALEGIPDDALAVPSERINDIARAYCVLNEIERYLPCVTAWCVVNSNSTFERQVPSVWVAATTETQANALRDAVAKHYDEQADRHKWIRDTWTVEHRPCRITRVLAPHVTCEDYIERLKR